MTFAIVVLAAMTVYASGIQEQIDAAQPGDTVYVTSGVYVGQIQLKDGISLIGAGSETCIIDAQGADAAVLGAQSALIAGFTIRNSHIGLQTGSHFMGVFNNVIEGTTHIGIHAAGGGVVIVNNLFRDNSGHSVIGVNSGKAYIFNNTIADNNCSGVWAWYPQGVVMRNNIVAFNKKALLIGAGATAETSHNNWFCDENPELGEKEFVADPLFVDREGLNYRLAKDSPAVNAGIALVPGQPLDLGMSHDVELTVQDARKMIRVALEDAAIDMPTLTYDVSLQELGMFFVTTSHPHPTFMIYSSSPNTIITEAVGWDVVENKTVPTDILEMEDRMAVKMKAEGEVEKHRYGIDATYFDDGSCHVDEDGYLTFDRETTFTNIRVVVPEGFTVLSCNLPFDIGEMDGREVLNITDFGLSRIIVKMQSL